ncbi:MAG: hypothetical protein OXF88_19100, partial [Rhodobacteraceae bacterium]|nr:hypothetical protein [Paracoccaceae bacterium]
RKPNWRGPTRILPAGLSRNAGRIEPEHRQGLPALHEDTVDGRLPRFVWLRQFSPGNNSAAANRLPDCLEYLKRLECPDDLFAGVPAHRITRHRRQGERYYADE